MTGSASHDGGGGIPGNDELPPGASTVEIVLTPDGGDTLVVLTHRGLPSGHLERHRTGWAERLAQLASGPQRAAK